eukprot:5835960-Prymnesium_polylepis.2
MLRAVVVLPRRLVAAVPTVGRSTGQLNLAQRAAVALARGARGAWIRVQRLRAALGARVGEPRGVRVRLARAAVQRERRAPQDEHGSKAEEGGGKASRPLHGELDEKRGDKGTEAAEAAWRGRASAKRVAAGFKRRPSEVQRSTQQGLRAERTSRSASPACKARRRQSRGAKSAARCRPCRARPCIGPESR